MSTCPFASNVAVAAKRTLRIVGLGGGGQAGAGGGWVAHAVRIVAATAEARIIAIAFFTFHRAPLSRSFTHEEEEGACPRSSRAGSRVGAGRRYATAERGDLAPPFLAEYQHQHLLINLLLL